MSNVHGGGGGEWCECGFSACFTAKTLSRKGFAKNQYSLSVSLASLRFAVKVGAHIISKHANVRRPAVQACLLLIRNKKSFSSKKTGFSFSSSSSYPYSFAIP